jgi:C-terminal processing protease CtpA/Prc
MLRTILAVCALLLFTLGGPVTAQPVVDVRYEGVVTDLMATPEGLAFLEAFRAIRRDYLGEANAGALLDGAIRGMVGVLADPYVRYLDVEQLAAERRTTRGPASIVALSLGDLGYLRLTSFDSERAGESFAAELEILMQRGVRALIVDLRGNSGGLVLGGLQVLDVFLSEVVLGYRATRFGQVPLGYANPRAVALPLAVLIDRDTASTAEIVAGALQTNGRARLYGEVSAGKGVGQSTVPLSHGGELRLVTFAWSLPDGRSIDGWGLTPDVPLRGQVAALAAGDLVRVVLEPELDPVLAMAVRDLRRVVGDDLGHGAGLAPPIQAETPR